MVTTITMTKKIDVQDAGLAEMQALCEKYNKRKDNGNHGEMERKMHETD